MNLTILIGNFPPGAFGGAELQAEAWARRLAERHRVTVVTRRVPPLPPRERRDGYEIVRLPVSRVPLLRTAVDLNRIVRAVDAIEPRPDVILCFQTFASGLAGVRAQRRLGVPAAVWVRSEVEYNLRSPRMRMIGPAVWRAARGVLVQSAAHRAAMLDALGRGAPGLMDAVAAKLEVIPNGVDLPPPPAVGRRGDRVLTVGRLIPDKGTDVVVEAMAGIGGRLTVAGEGPERGRLMDLARARGVDARFEGYVGRERLEVLFREASCLVLGARRGEGRPNVLLEAMARGLPVVATRIAGVTDLVADGVNGLLVPADDSEALLAALARLEREPDLADRLGRAARESVEAFAWDVVEPQLEAVLDRWMRA